MKHRFPHKLTRRTLAAAAVLALGMATAPLAFSARGGDDGGGGDDDGGGSGGHELLTLRANDAIGAPGGTVVVVLRTYAPRLIRQGQISVRARKPAPSVRAFDLAAVTQPLRPWATLLSSAVYSVRGDSVLAPPALTGTVDSQQVRAAFSSQSGTINGADGPLAIFRLKLSPSVVPGQTFVLEVDPAQTSLVDAAGQPIAIEPRNGVLTIRAKNAPFEIEAEGDKPRPGEIAELGVSTFEPFALASGQVTLRYDPRFGTAPQVRMDPRYGRATFRVERPRPGVLKVVFQSPNKTLNTVPGKIIAIDLPTPANGAVGLSAPITFDPAGTWFVGANGRRLAVKLENGRLEFR